MPKNIKCIKLTDESYRGDGLRTVRIEFNIPCTWTVLNIEDLKQIIRCWIQGEEEKYPISKGFKGRWMLFEEIEKIFKEEGGENENEKWAFCPEKKCYSCGRDISKDATLNGRFVTGCPYCHRSFID